MPSFQPGIPPGGLAPTTTTITEEQRLVAAELAVQNFCQWHIAPTATTVVDVDGSGRGEQVLPTRHLATVSGVTLDGTPLTEGAHYTVAEIGILRRIDGGRFCGRLHLTMTHGYATPPPDVQAIIADMARSAASVAVGASGERAGPFQTNYSGASHVAQGGVIALSDQQKRALSAYALEPSF